MLARFAARSPTTVARFLRAFRKESKRSPRCDSQAYMWPPSEVTLQRACPFSGWGRRCFVSSDKPSPSSGFSEISQVSMRFSKTINLSAIRQGATELSDVSFGWRPSIHDSAQRKPEQSRVTEKLSKYRDTKRTEGCRTERWRWRAWHYGSSPA